MSKDMPTPNHAGATDVLAGRIASSSVPLVAQKPESSSNSAGATDVPAGSIAGSSVPRAAQVSEPPLDPEAPPKPAPSPKHGLKPEHFRAVSMLLSGESPTETAKACGCSRSTIARWRNDPHFAAYYQERLRELHETLKRKIQVLALESGDGLLDAHRALRGLLTDETASPYVRNSAASNLMKESRKWITALGYGDKVESPAEQQPVPVAPAQPPPVAAVAVAVPAPDAKPPLTPEKPRESTDSGREPASGKRESKRAADAIALTENGKEATPALKPSAAIVT